jgi:hypothetical protein
LPNAEFVMNGVPLNEKRKLTYPRRMSGRPHIFYISCRTLLLAFTCVAGMCTVQKEDYWTILNYGLVAVTEKNVCVHPHNFLRWSLAYMQGWLQNTLHGNFISMKSIWQHGKYGYLMPLCTVFVQCCATICTVSQLNSR